MSVTKFSRWGASGNVFRNRDVDVDDDDDDDYDIDLDVDVDIDVDVDVMYSPQQCQVMLQGFEIYSN